MNVKKIALLLACELGLGLGLMAASGSSFAVDYKTNKPATPMQMGDPKTRDMADRCDEHEPGMMGWHSRGVMGDHDGGMMEGYGERMMGGMMMESPRMNVVRSLDLSDEQLTKINKLSDELQHKNWAAQGAIMDEAAKLRDLYEADKRDPVAIDKEYQKIFDAKRQMIEAMVDTQNRVEEVLTPEQRAQLKKKRHQMGPMR